MVSLFSFFNSKKRLKSTDPRRPASPTSPKRVRSVRTPPKQSSSATFKAEAARRASSDGHGLASKRLKAATAGATLSCTTATANASSAGLAHSPSLAPPRINISLPFEVHASSDDVNASLGLDGVGRTPTLSAAERRTLDAQRYLPADLQAVWEWLGPEFATKGAETVGIMLPRRLETSKDRQRQLASLFVLARRPQLADKFPSLTSRYPTVPQDQAVEAWKSRLVAVAKDTPNPVDLAEVLKTIVRRLAGNARPIIDPATYVRFVQQEHAASYPRVAYANMLVPHLSEDVVGLLGALFEVLSAIALHAESNSMSAGRLCHLFGWWLLGTMPDGTTSWTDLYEAYRLAGQRTEHLFYAHVRWQTTQQKMPRRLVQLILSYPFGESSASSEHLPLPPASTFPRRVLHVTLGTDSTLPTGTDPDKALSDALIAKLDEDVTAPAWLAIRGDDINAVTLQGVLSIDSREFLAELAAAKGLDFTTSPATPTRLPDDEFHYQPFENSLQGRRRSMSCDVPRLEVGGSGASVVPGNDGSPGSKRGIVRQSSAINLSPTRSSRVTPPQWNDFLQSGFGETSDGMRELSLSLTKPTTPLRLSTGSGAPSGGNSHSQSQHLQIPKKRIISEGKTTTSYVISSEEIVEMDDGFIHFVEDGQLDPIASSSWPRFALVQLAQPISTVSSNDPVDWLLVTVKKREAKRLPSLDEPMPDLRSPDPLRPLSPSTGETSHSRFSTAFGFGSLANRFRRKSYFAELASHAAPSRSRSLQPITYKRESRHISKGSAASDAPTEYTIGDMGEIVKIPSLPSSPTSPQPAPIQMDPTLSRTSPSDWVYLGEGGAHVVFRYRGSDPALQGRAMRLVKATDAGTPGVALRHTWADTLLPQLVPAVMLAAPKSAVVDEKWTRAIVTPTELMRPAERRTEGKPLAESVDYARPVQLLDDLTCGVAGEKVLAIEIKPKWGFLPQAQYLTPPESIPIKTRNCRYCLHAHYRGESVDGAAQYCPLDLYSGDGTRLRHALEGLWEGWHRSQGGKNNLRVYVDGNKVLPGSAELIPTIRAGRLSEGTSDFLVPLLGNSGALQQLKVLQSTLDATNISDLARQFTIQHPGVKPFDSSLISEPTAAELTAFVKRYLSEPSAGTRPYAWNLREREIAFMLSAIFKDCSMIIRAVLRPTDGGWELDEDKSSVKLIDTDLKPLGNLGKWFELDEKLWRHWMATRGCEEPTIVIPAEPKDSPHHSYHNLAKSAGATAAGAVVLSGVAAAVYATPQPSPNPDDSSRHSIASIDAANTALAHAIPEALVSKEVLADAPATEAEPALEPEIRAALERFNSPQAEDELQTQPEAPAKVLAEPEPKTVAELEPSSEREQPKLEPEASERSSSIDVPPPAQTSEAIVPSTIVPTSIVPSSDLARSLPAKDEKEVETAPVATEQAEVETAPVAEISEPAPVQELTAVEEAIVAPVEVEVEAEPQAETAEAPVEAAEVEAEATPVRVEAEPTPLEAAETPLEAAEPEVVPVETTESPAAIEAPEVADTVQPSSKPPATIEATPEPIATPEPSSAEAPSSTADKKATFAALSTGAAAGTVAAATAALTSPREPLAKKLSFTKDGFSKKNVTPPSGSVAQPDAPPLHRKTSDLESKSRVARISSLFNRRASGSGTPSPQKLKPVSPQKSLKSFAPPKSPKETKEPKEKEKLEREQSEGFAARFRKPKKSGASDVSPTVPVPAALPASSTGSTTAAPAAIAGAGAAVAAAGVAAVAALKTDKLEPIATEDTPIPAPEDKPETPPEEAMSPDFEDAPEREAEEAVVEIKADDPKEEAPVEEVAARVPEPDDPQYEIPSSAPIDAPERIPVPDDTTEADANASFDASYNAEGDHDYSASPHTPAQPIRETFSSLEATPSSPYTPARLGRQTSLTMAANAFPRLSAFGDDLRLGSPDLLSLNQSPITNSGSPVMGDTSSPIYYAVPNVVRTKYVELDSPTDSPLRKADTAFPRLSAFIDKEAPGIDALRQLGEAEDAAMGTPTPIKEESRSLLPSPVVATFADSGAPVRTPPMDAFGITTPEPAAAAEAEDAPAVPAVAALSTVDGYDSESSSLIPPSEGRTKRSTAPSPSPHLFSADSNASFEAELSHVAEEQPAEDEEEPAADESQLLANADVALTPQRGASTPPNVELYSHAALPPLPTPEADFPRASIERPSVDPTPYSTDLAHPTLSRGQIMITEAETESVIGSDAFATAPVSPFVSKPATSIVSVFDQEDDTRTLADEPDSPAHLLSRAEITEPTTPIAPTTPMDQPTTPKLGAFATPTRANILDTVAADFAAKS